MTLTTKKTETSQTKRKRPKYVKRTEHRKGPTLNVAERTLQRLNQRADHRVTSQARRKRNNQIQRHIAFTDKFYPPHLSQVLSITPQLPAIFQAQTNKNTNTAENDTENTIYKYSKPVTPPAHQWLLNYTQDLTYKIICEKTRRHWLTSSNPKIKL